MTDDNDDRLSHRPFAVFEKLAEDAKRTQARERRKARAEWLERATRPSPSTTEREGGDGGGAGAQGDTVESAAAGPALTEEAFFAQEMNGVRRLPADKRSVAPRAPRATLPPARDDSAEAMDELADLVHGRVQFDLADSDEFVEGIAVGVDRRVLKRLRNGSLAWQAHLDLHGLTRVEAREQVELFLAQARLRRHRCVLIIHGRGLNSKDQVPVLKERLRVWLAQGRIARNVLAFCSARPTDGGLGAVYVLLRK